MDFDLNNNVDYQSIVGYVASTFLQQQWDISYLMSSSDSDSDDSIEEISQKEFLKLVEIRVNGNNPICVPVDDWLKTNYFPIGEIYLEPGIVYDCPKHGDEALEWLYGTDSMFITAKTLSDLVKSGQITISEK